MSFSNRLRKIAQPIWDAQLVHPFVVQLGDGTLPERKFRYYILQDARFLGDLARVFSAAAQKAPDSESALRFNDLAKETNIVLNKLVLTMQLLTVDLRRPGDVLTAEDLKR